MLRRAIAALLMAALLLSACSLGGAKDQKKHDADLKRILFGTETPNLSEQEEQRFQAIADAAAIAIDQFSSTEGANAKKKVYESLQNTLKNIGVPELPFSFESIDLNKAVTANNANVGSDHRKYTHMGWNYAKYDNLYKDKEFWRRRKQVLTHTVNWTLFHSDAPLKWAPWIRDKLYAPSEQCEAFSIMVYCVHILGDHKVAEKPSSLTYLEPLVQYNSLSAPGIIIELEEQLGILFADQKTSWTYATLMYDLSALSAKVERECGMWGDIDTDEECAANRKYATELLDILAANVPQLLMKEKFFKSHFGS